MSISIKGLGSDVSIKFNGVLNDASNVVDIIDIFNALSTTAREELADRVVFVAVTSGVLSGNIVSVARFCTEESSVYAELYNGNVDVEEICTRSGMSRSLCAYLTIDGWDDVQVSLEDDFEIAFSIFNITISRVFLLMSLHDVVRVDLSYPVGNYEYMYLATFYDSLGNRFEVPYSFFW